MSTHQATRPSRKILQIAGTGPNLFALCDDGSLWIYHEVYVHKKLPEENKSSGLQAIFTMPETVWRWDEFEGIPQDNLTNGGSI